MIAQTQSDKAELKGEKMSSPTQQKAEELYEKARMAAYVLEDESDQSTRDSAECRYRIIVAEYLFLILSNLGVLRTLAFGFLGFFLSCLIMVIFKL